MGANLLGYPEHPAGRYVRLYDLADYLGPQATDRLLSIAMSPAAPRGTQSRPQSQASIKLSRSSSVVEFCIEEFCEPTKAVD